MAFFLMGFCVSGTPPAVVRASFYALSVGLSLLVMVTTDSKHPPASGTALGIVREGFSLHTVAAMVIGVVLLALIHHLHGGALRKMDPEDEEPGSS